jgi:hypothetical protein
MFLRQKHTAGRTVLYRPMLVTSHAFIFNFFWKTGLWNFEIKIRSISQVYYFNLTSRSNWDAADDNDDHVDGVRLCLWTAATRWYTSLETTVEWYRQRKTLDSPPELSGNPTSRKILRQWPTASLPLQRKACCGFLSLLKIDRPRWTLGPMASMLTELEHMAVITVTILGLSSPQRPSLTTFWHVGLTHFYVQYSLSFFRWGTKYAKN